jgi:hypothetical protein
MTPISATGGFLTVTDLNNFNGPAQTANWDSQRWPASTPSWNAISKID